MRIDLASSEEAYGCNTIGLPNGKVMVAKGYPTVAKVLEERGLETIEIDMSEIRRPTVR